MNVAFDKLTEPERIQVLVPDGSVIKRNRSNKVELLAKVYDHVEHKFQKGFTLLILGWSDDSALSQLDLTYFPFLKSNRYQESIGNVAHHSNSYKTRKEKLIV